MRFRGALISRIIICEGVTNIGEYAFSWCTELTSIIIPEGVTSIGARAFNDCTQLKSIIIPDSVTSIEKNTFYGCSNLTEVFYLGTEQDWADMTVEDGNNKLLDATVYFYSESEPTDDGNYWHYDTDGKTPVIWQ